MCGVYCSYVSKANPLKALATLAILTHNPTIF